MLKKSRYLPSGSNCARELAAGTAKNGGWKVGSSCPNASLPDVKSANITAINSTLFFGFIFSQLLEDLEIADQPPAVIGLQSHVPASSHYPSPGFAGRSSRSSLKIFTKDFAC